jgi:hypothetical protein
MAYPPSMESGGLEHLHDTPPYPFTPSPSFNYSSPERDADTPAMPCTFMPDIPSQENLGSGRAGSSAKLVSDVPAGNAVTTGSDD